MKVKSTTLHSLLAVAAGMVFLASSAAVNAQVETTTSTTHGAPTHEVQVQKGTVVMVQGNDLWVKDESGQIHHFANVPESVHVTVNGQQLGIHDLKPGMTIERTTITTTTPKMITTTQSVTGKVWHVNPPLSVILTLDNNTNQEFKIPKGQKFNVNGQMVDAWGLKKGMTVSATKVVEVPETVVTQKKNPGGANASSAAACSGSANPDRRSGAGSNSGCRSTRSSCCTRSGSSQDRQFVAFRWSLGPIAVGRILRSALVPPFVEPHRLHILEGLSSVRR